MEIIEIGRRGDRTLPAVCPAPPQQIDQMRHRLQLCLMKAGTKQLTLSADDRFIAVCAQIELLAELLCDHRHRLAQHADDILVLCRDPDGMQVIAQRVQIDRFTVQQHAVAVKQDSFPLHASVRRYAFSLSMKRRTRASSTSFSKMPSFLKWVAMKAASATS